MNDAGYHETSIALWQALIEFLLFKPQSVDRSKALASFEAYWDSEVPRVGEDGWVTWATYEEKGDGALPQPLAIQTRSLDTSSPNLVEQFVHTERQLQDDLQFPGRTIDDAAEDDPFHVVLFSDLEPVLSSLYLVPNTQPLIVMGFLCYCGLPPLRTDRFEDTCKWWFDPFFKHQGYHSWNDDNTDTSNSNSFPASFGFSKITTGGLFGSAMDIELGVRKGWISYILKVFVQLFSDNDKLCEYYIAFTLKQFAPS
jgi:hypothetical protein